MNISYMRNSERMGIGLKETSPVVNELYSHYHHESYSIEKDLGIYYYKFKARENHILEASYSDTYIKLVLCLSGYANNNINSKATYNFEENQSMLYQVKPDNYLSKILSEKEIEIIHLHLPIASIEKYLSDNDLFNQIMSGKKLKRQLLPTNKQIIHQLKHSPYNASLNTLFIEKLILEHLLHFLNEEVKYQLKQNSSMEEAKHLLDQSESFITISQLSRLLGINEFKLKKDFRSQYNTSIYQYQKDKRLDEAWLMLHETTLSLNEIMNYCGYESIGSFSNTFYKKFSVRPSQIRKS